MNLWIFKCKMPYIIILYECEYWKHLLIRDWSKSLSMSKIMRFFQINYYVIASLQPSGAQTTFMYHFMLQEDKKYNDFYHEFCLEANSLASLASEAASVAPVLFLMSAIDSVYQLTKKIHITCLFIQLLNSSGCLCSLYCSNLNSNY